jgi:hypothetical protein
MTDMEFARVKRWLSRPEEIVEIETYSDCVVIHLEGGRRVEIGAKDPSEDLDFLIRDKEDK